ncbi:886_t:CDS:2 [Funneliformis geosporum]|uniref:17014_t:CDS:1 n=1 Tax=Funneliformis geosporum TaxID=1117311 RepID=A0A9W4SJZ5_9GLOM|nr:17014_t:CDS:2 [Funneliformis geosporum]CAI2177262.1 886_t:CDS:2 [Funneliformis geosporum]
MSIQCLEEAKELSMRKKIDKLKKEVSYQQRKLMDEIDKEYDTGKLQKKMKYVEPKPLLNTDGLSWQFQKSDELMDTFKDALLNHYDNFRSKRIDKILILAYFILADAGTDKSRIATELS